MTKSFVTIADLSKEKIMSLLEAAARFEANPNRKTLDGRVIATLFFEPSTRTRLSFETAVNRLGGRVIGFSDAATSSSSKGESLKDTIMMVKPTPTSKPTRTSRSCRHSSRAQRTA